MASYVVTGASRGIGLELVKQLLELPAAQVGKVFTLTRTDPSGALKDLLNKSSDRAVHVPAAVNNTESVEKAAREIKSKLGTQGLDVLVNNAGISSASPEGIKTSKPEQLAKTFDVNVIGTQRMTSAFLPLLEAGKQKKVINISSTLGSVAWVDRFKQSPTPAYKISKAALHMLNAQYAMDHADAGFTFLCVSPGWLKTDLGSQYADLEVEVGVRELRRIIIDAGVTQNGKFVNIHVPGRENDVGHYDGGSIPW